MSPKTKWSLLLLALFPLASTNAVTGDPGEEREVYALRYLVFQHQDFWDDPAFADGPPSSSLQRPSPEDQERLSGSMPEAGRLEGFWRALAESSRYRPLRGGVSVPLAHPEDEARPLPVTGDWPASIRPAFAALEGPAERPMRLAVGDSAVPSASIPGDWSRDRVRGTLTFHKGRYPHLTVDLWLTEIRRWMPWGPDIRHYSLHQSRRLKVDQYYYFDHPRFGVLARVEKLQPSQTPSP